MRLFFNRQYIGFIKKYPGMLLGYGHMDLYFFFLSFRFLDYWVHMKLQKSVDILCCNILHYWFDDYVDHEKNTDYRE